MATYPPGRATLHLVYINTPVNFLDDTVNGGLAAAVANHTDRIIWTCTLKHHD